MPNKFITEFNADNGNVRVGYYPANRKSVPVRISQGDDAICLNETELEYLIATLQAVKNVAPAMKKDEEERPNALTGTPFKLEDTIERIKEIDGGFGLGMYAND